MTRRTPISIVLVVLMAAWLTTPALAFDDHGPLNPPQLLPYNGVVELNGAAVSGTLKMRFTLDDNAAVERDLSAVDPPLWQDVVLVECAAGRFHVDLGASAALPANLLRSDQLFLGVDICSAGTEVAHCQQPDSSDWVVMSSSKKFVPVPYAYLSAQSIDMKVNGDLQVTNDARVDQELTVGGGLSVSGETILGSASLASAAVSGTLTLGSWQLHGGCPSGWSDGDGFCASPVQAASSVHEAQMSCARMGADTCSVGQYYVIGTTGCSDNRCWTNSYCTSGDAVWVTAWSGWSCANWDTSYQFRCCMPKWGPDPI